MVQTDIPDSARGFGAASADEAKLFESFSRNWTSTMDGMKGVRFRFGEDAEGSPAVWIIVLVPDETGTSKREKELTRGRLRRWREATDVWKTEILTSGSNRWPYVTFEPEKVG